MTNGDKFEFIPETNYGSGVAVHDVQPASSSADPGRIPKGMPLSIPQSQAYFWTRAWQEAERTHIEEREAGELRSFDNATDLIRWLLEPGD